MIITGWSAITSAGIGALPLIDRLRRAQPFTPSVHPGTASRSHSIDGDPLPEPTAHALDDFDVRAELGRKGTSSFDRATALAVVCCRETLRDAGLNITDDHRERIGVALGTTIGSYKSTSDYSRETLIQEKPYLVNPMLFPNTVMNCAAGQVAIRFGLRGVNATIAGGALAFLNTLRYADNALTRRYADVMLTGAVEEYTPHRAWSSHLTGVTHTVPCGEAAAVFTLSRPDTPVPTNGPPRARVLAVRTAYGPGGGSRAEHALRSCVAQAVEQAGVHAKEITTVITGEVDPLDTPEFGPAAAALGHEPELIQPKRLFGECDAASGAIGLAVHLACHRDDGHLALITGRSPEGAVGAAIVEGCAHAGPDRR
ncbi:beta-ketoacyl synthase N-terminal-like domain-containing protein [Micromonospora sediminicola]|uniref:beta-ketoacyl synthase N-terminal-like domain-containing protein n=1 Tax=Micromonospora sediminicola TaxID=946078 RepID=UPI0033DC2824